MEMLGTQLPEATSLQLLHYLEVDLNNNIDTVLIPDSTKDIFNSSSNISRLQLNVNYMVNYVP